MTMALGLHSAVEEIGLASIPIGPPKLTRFEKARIIGARALQITLGAPILITPPAEMTRPIDIALLELEKSVLPIMIRRRVPDGNVVDIPLKAFMKASE